MEFLMVGPLDDESSSLLSKFDIGLTGLFTIFFFLSYISLVVSFVFFFFLYRGLQIHLYSIPLVSFSVSKLNFN
eukprot:UN01166